LIATKRNITKNNPKDYQKPIADFLVCGGLFCYASSRKGGDFLTIEEYIKSKETFRLMPFVTIYTAICELINDGFVEQSAFEKGGVPDVAVCEQKPEKQSCRRLYRQSDFISNR
jgi:hypothetical protein